MKFQNSTATINGAHQLTVTAAAGNVFIRRCDWVRRRRRTRRRHPHHVLRERGFSSARFAGSRRPRPHGFGHRRLQRRRRHDDRRCGHDQQWRSLDHCRRRRFHARRRLPQTGAGSTSLAGDISTTGDAVSFNAGVTIAANASGGCGNRHRHRRRRHHLYRGARRNDPRHSKICDSMPLVMTSFSAGLSAGRRGSVKSPSMRRVT